MPAELPVRDDRLSTFGDDEDPSGRSYTPADWARNRGEVEVAELLETYEHPEFPRLIAGEAYARGTLVRYNVEKGFGFLEPECDKSHVFVHVSALYDACTLRGRPTRRAFVPQPGQRLAFVLGKGKGGRPQAVRVANAEGLSYIESEPLDREAAIRAWDDYARRRRADYGDY